MDRPQRTLVVTDHPDAPNFRRRATLTSYFTVVSWAKWDTDALCREYQRETYTTVVLDCSTNEDSGRARKLIKAIMAQSSGKMDTRVGTLIYFRAHMLDDLDLRRFIAAENHYAVVSCMSGQILLTQFLHLLASGPDIPTLSLVRILVETAIYEQSLSMTDPTRDIMLHTSAYRRSVPYYHADRLYRNTLAQPIKVLHLTGHHTIGPSTTVHIADTAILDGSYITDIDSTPRLLLWNGDQYVPETPRPTDAVDKTVTSPRVVMDSSWRYCVYAHATMSEAKVFWSNGSATEISPQRDDLIAASRDLIPMFARSCGSSVNIPLIRHRIDTGIAYLTEDLRLMLVPTAREGPPHHLKPAPPAADSALYKVVCCSEDRVHFALDNGVITDSHAKGQNIIINRTYGPVHALLRVHDACAAVLMHRVGAGWESSSFSIRLELVA